MASKKGGTKVFEVLTPFQYRGKLYSRGMKFVVNEDNAKKHLEAVKAKLKESGTSEDELAAMVLYPEDRLRLIEETPAPAAKKVVEKKDEPKSEIK